MSRFLVARFGVPALLVAACSATAPLPDQPAPAGSAGLSATAGSGAGGKGAQAVGGGASGIGGAGLPGGDGGVAGGGSTKGGAAGNSGAGAMGGEGNTGPGGNAGSAGADTGTAGAGGGSDPFGGGGTEGGGASGAESCELEAVPPGDGLLCSSINYITTGDPCLGCDRGPSLYFCEGKSAPPSPGCSTLPSQGAGYFCCDKSVCTPQPGGCDGAVRYHCPPDATVPSACKKLGGDLTSYCCPT